MVVLATAMQQGVTPARAAKLQELFGVSLRTLARWREWWSTAFAESAFWKSAKALFASAPNMSEFPHALLECFGPDEQARLVALLRFLGPISTPAGYIPDRRF